MYILSDGKNYVMENELKIGEYMPTTYAVKAKKFTYKQAKSFLSRPGKRYSWVRSYQMIDDGSGEKPDQPFTYKGNAGAYIGKNDVAAKIRKAVDLVLEDGSVLTPDIGGTATTIEYEKAIIAHL